jgi:hypothetical protein
MGVTACDRVILDEEMGMVGKWWPGKGPMLLTVI